MVSSEERVDTGPPPYVVESRRDNPLDRGGIPWLLAVKHTRGPAGPTQLSPTH